ncbi:MAG: outer membrane beta-barrel protein, partial [Elusimicrobia bacterium]|nr:outer membrane beta-barrel protein [Elusimicrobiota bacterium]
MKKITLLFALMFFSVSVIYADKPLKFIFSEDIGYDDNIYLSSEDKTGSAVSSTQLFAEYLVNIPNTGLKFGANANVGYNAYLESPAKNDYMNAGAGLNIGNRFFSVEEEFLYTADPATSELTDRAKRINNYASFKIKTSSEKMFSIGFLVSDILDKYIDDQYENLNRNRINIGAQAYYNLSSRTSFYIGYLFSNINYEDNEYSNSIGNSFILGVNGTVAQKIKGSAQISYDMRNYDKEVDGLEKDADIFGYLLSLTYEPTNRSSIVLSGERKIEESVFTNNRYYISTEVGIEYKQKIFQKWEAGLFVSYENIDYPGKIDGVN